MNMFWALLPVKEVTESKQRLAGLLHHHEREGLVLAMLRDVLTAITEVEEFDGVLLVSRSQKVQALAREFVEEAALRVVPTALLHVPGTLFSPWTFAPYTPVYYAVAGDGEPRVPDHEPVALAFMTPEQAIASARMAEPEIEALRRAVRLAEGRCL